MKVVSKSQHSKDTKSRRKPRKVEFYPLADNQQSVVRGLAVSPIPKMTERQKTRFLGRLDKTIDCWLWTSGCNYKGYGEVSLNHKQYLSHRISYATHYGIDPGNFIVDHKCNNPSCCNPNHLQLMTPKENVHKMMSQGRHNVGRGNTIVSIEHHHQIVDDVISRRKTLTQIGEDYGVGRVCISRIVAKYEDVDMRKKLLDSDIEFIVSSDLMYREIAHQFNVSEETIARIRHLAGLPDRRLHLTDAEREFVLNSDERATILANKFDVHTSTIYRLRARQQSAERED